MSAANYEPVIGLEVHCQLATATKMFAPCPFQFAREPNTLVDPYTIGLPGTLPVPNRAAVDLALRVALATGSEIQHVSRWARKHYFYPDLPKGYQITQADHPYALGGVIEVPGPRGREEESTRVRLIRIHMEEDAGKNTHVPGENVSLVDYNRAGVPLIEIVSEPDIRAADEAARYLRELRTLVRALGVSRANMEEGTLRCDANVSLRPRGSDTLGVRCEIKNLNSFKFLDLAIRAEIRRQVDILDSGGSVVMCTLSYDTARDRTRVMRTKEEAADYRYFPEPDMPPLLVDDAWIASARAQLPELPAARRARYREAGVPAGDAAVLAGDPTLAEFFDRVLAALEGSAEATAAGVTPKVLCNWVTGELLRRVNEREGPGDDDRPLGVEPAWIVDIATLARDGTVSGRAAKEVFGKSFAEGVAPREVVERDGYRQVSDEGALTAIVQEIMARSAKQVAQYRGGKHKVFGYFVGQVMKATRGQANPAVVQRVLKAALNEGGDGE